MISASNPRGGPDFRLAAADVDDVRATALRLRAGQATWAASIEHRLTVFAAWRQALLARREALVEALSEDTGRQRLARSEFDGVLSRLDFWAERASGLLSRPAAGESAMMPSVRYEHRLSPLGLVGVIGPWNFPFLLPLIDAIPALLAGCAVLIKPSEVTPRLVQPLRQTIADAPELAAVLAVAPGGPACGEAVVDAVDAVCFTGSVATGRRVGAQAGGRLIPAFLELGGKDPLIVLPEADLALAVRVALRASVLATGQACQSIERIYVHASVHDDFLVQLTSAAKAVRLNLARVDQGQIGPFIDPRQADRVAEQLADALAEGAEQHCGGLIRQDGGVWCQPVVLSRLHHGMRLYQEETFGPVLPVMPFADDAEAVRLANDSEFGLSASVLGEEAHALALAEQLRAGAVSVNDAGLTGPVGDVEKESFGVSGLGRSRMGKSGLLRFLRRQALLIQTGEPLPLAALAEEAS